MELYGMLQMVDDESGDFEIVTENGAINVSKLLDGIFESGLRPQVYIKIMRSESLLLEEEGGLFLNKDKQGVDSYFVCGLNLSKLLWDNTEECLEITIKRRKQGNNER